MAQENTHPQEFVRGGGAIRHISGAAVRLVWFFHSCNQLSLPTG